MKRTLTTNDHSRDSAGMTYVYPVISRRAGGLSIGINLNPNNACNWRCIYCQVPALRRGGAPSISIDRLRDELRTLLTDALAGDFFERYGVAEEQRGIRDIAISGNGEPTSAREFEAVVQTIGDTADAFELLGKIKCVLITNGSLIRQRRVQRGLSLLAGLQGEVWFKLDSATPAGRRLINGTAISTERVRANLKTATALCPTWIQTCVFGIDGRPFPEEERCAYLAFLEKLPGWGIRPEGILLYGLARPSMQPESHRLMRLPESWMEDFANAIRALGLAVRVTP